MNDGLKVPGAREDRRCPRCRMPLFEGRQGPAELLGCGRCGGVWLDEHGCQAVADCASQALVALAEQAGRAATVVAEEGPAYCPVCSSLLTSTPMPPTMITVDTCPEHGAWFDPNELRILALAFLPPTLPPDAALYAQAKAVQDRQAHPYGDLSYISDDTQLQLGGFWGLLKFLSSLPSDRDP